MTSKAPKNKSNHGGIRTRDLSQLQATETTAAEFWQQTTRPDPNRQLTTPEPLIWSGFGADGGSILVTGGSGPRAPFAY